MTFGDVFKLLGLDIEVDGKARTWDLALGPVRLKNLAFRTPNLLIGDRRMIGDLLSECFVERRVMWKDLRSETPAECLVSLDELITLLQQNILKLQSSGDDKDKTLSEVLSMWQARAVLAEKELKDAVDTATTGPSVTLAAPEAVACNEAQMRPMVEFRIATLPTVGFLIDLLPDGDPIKSDAQTFRTQAYDELVRYHSISVDQLQQPDWQLVSAVTS